MGKLQHIMITGGAGFIGSHLVERLAETGRDITIFDNFDPYYDPILKRKNIRFSLSKENVSLVEGDIKNQALVDSIVRDRKIDGIIHLAARAGVRSSIIDPLSYESTNIGGTTNLLETARKYGIKQFIFASSSSVYGSDSIPPFKESAPCTQPTSVYAATKRAGELMCRTYFSLYRLPVVCLRFFTVYGPRQRPEMAIHKFFGMIQNGEEIPVFGKGKLLRDFTFVEDITDGVISAINLDQHKFEIINLGTTQTIVINDLIKKIENILNKTARKNYLPQQPGDLDVTRADISYAQKVLNYNPKTTIEEGLMSFWEWYQTEFINRK